MVEKKIAEHKFMSTVHVLSEDNHQRCITASPTPNICPVAWCAFCLFISDVVVRSSGEIPPLIPNIMINGT